MISVPQVHLMHHHICLRKMLHCDNCVLHPLFSFSGLLLKLTYTSFIAAMSLAFLNDYSWFVALAILGKHHPLSSIQTSGSDFPQHHPHPDWTHWPNCFLGHPVSKLLGSFMQIIQIIPTSPFCTLHFWARFCISLKLFQFSYFLGLTAGPLVVQSIKFILCLITDLSKEVVAKGIWKLKGTSLCSPVWLQSGLLVSDLDWRLNGLE